jgi:ankyrin repeat protein
MNGNMKQLDARRTQRQEAARRISQDIMPSEGYSEQWKNNDSLYNAAMAGNVHSIRLNLEAGADLNARFSGLNITALHAAAMHNQPKACAFLVKKGADIFATDDVGHTPLQTAISWRSMLAVPTLAEAAIRAIVGKKNGKEFVWYLRACLSS